jgi:hypothetical protein
MAKFYPQWRNENSLRQYPFEDSATCTSLDGKLKLAESWLVDAAFFVRGATLPLRLGRVTVSGDSAHLAIVDNNGAEVGLAKAIKNDLKPIKVTNSIGQWCGTLVPGTNANYALFTAGNGTYQFNTGDAEFVVSCVLSLPTNSGLAMLTNDLGQQYIPSDLVLVGEGGVQLETMDATEYQVNGTTEAVKLIRIHAMGDPQYLHSLCTADETRRPTRFIKQLTFQYGTQSHTCAPDKGGNILILADTIKAGAAALQVLATSSGINVRLPGKSIG